MILNILNAVVIVNAVVLSAVIILLAPIARERLRAAWARRYVEMVLSFGPTRLEGNSTMCLVVPTRSRFAGRRLIVPSSLSSSFMINDITVDGKSVFVSENPIPAAAFSENAVGVGLDMPEIPVGGRVMLSVSNKSDAPQPFTAAMLGRVPRKQARDLQSAAAN